jgi:hypothetical protein
MSYYTELDNTLYELERSRENIVHNIHDISTSEDISNLKSLLAKHGIIILTGAVSDKSVESLHQNIRDCAKKMYDIDISNMDIFDDLNPYRNPANGFGNASFGYFFKQPCAIYDTIKTELNGDNVYLTENSGYQVNLALLEDNPHTAAVLLALTHPTGGMISWDSFKLSNNPSPKPKNMTKQELTKCHFDAYGGGVNNDITYRHQAIIAIEDKIKLGYVPDSINQKVKDLIQKVSKNSLLYDQDGFKSFADLKLLDIFNKYVIAPPSGSLVLWNSGVIHYEAEFNKINCNNLHRYKSSVNLPNQKRIRCVVGLHKPQNLDRSELMELARLAENGLIPDMYFGINKKSKIYSNIMCSKTTQYKVYRTLTQDQRDSFNLIIQNKDLIKLNKISNLKKHLYGISQDIDSLELSDADRDMIQDSLLDTSKKQNILITDKKVTVNTTKNITENTTKKSQIAPIAPKNGRKRKAIARRAI